MDVVEGIKSSWELLTIGGAGAGVFWRYVVLPSRAAVRRVVATCAQVDVMSKALGKNGGSSLADKIDETRDVVLLTAAQVKDILDHTEQPLWAADERGQSVSVNRAFEQTFGYPQAELLGSGWIQHVAPSDRERVNRELNLALAENRAFRTKCDYATNAGVVISVVIKGEPVIDGIVGRVIAWRGSVEVIQLPQVKA